MPTPSPVRTDQLDAARYPVVANNLRTAARFYQATVTSTIADRDQFDTFAEPVRNLIQQKLEEIAVGIRSMAEQAEEFAAQARERLGVAS